jgi:hypothetical protein
MGETIFLLGIPNKFLSITPFPFLSKKAAIAY